VFSRLDPADLDRRLGTYFTALAAAKQACPDGLLAVALDGKTLRGARRAGATAAHLVSVFAHRAGLVLGRLAVAEKSNELPCVRKLLRLFRQMRLMVTVDSMHTSKSTATLICATLKSHYLMIVKSDQPTLLARIQALPWNEVPVTHTEEPEIAHGRIETRTLKVLTAARGSASPRPADRPDHPRTRRVHHRRPQHRDRVRHLQRRVRTRPPGDDRGMAARALGHREPCALRTGCDLRRGPLDRAHRHRPTGHGQPEKHSPQSAPAVRRRQHRRSLPPHSLQQQPRPQPPRKPTKPQVSAC